MTIIDSEDEEEKKPVVAQPICISLLDDDDDDDDDDIEGKSNIARALYNDPNNSFIETIHGPVIILNLEPVIPDEEGIPYL